MNERTSFTVASKAAFILGSGKRQMEAAIADAQRSGASGHAIHLMRQYMEFAEICAGSALTQKEADNTAIRDEIGI